ncbi:MAG TPA: sugar phosphate isomerase/epimerase [Thermoflexia bacterium]|nr:sugar phosphate isomerase/epimerase [Thermoflexia bacterium]
MHPRRIGVSTACFFPQTLTEETLAIIAELGFSVTEAFLQVDGEYNAAFAAKLDRQRHATGVQIHSLHITAMLFDLWSAYPRMRQETRDRFLRALEVAARVEARAITWHGLRYGLDNPRLVAAFLESLAWASEQAQQAGVTLCVENVSWCYLRRPEHVQKLLASGLPCGFTFDVFQAAESGVDPVALLQAMGDRLTTVHLSDYAPEGARHLLPGQGTLDWDAVLHALQELHYQGPLLLEVAHLQDPQELVQAWDFIQQQAAQERDLEIAGEVTAS